MQANWAGDGLTNTVDVGNSSGVGVGGSSWYGALAWTSLHTTDPHYQIMHLLSFVDDYDGSKNRAQVATIWGAKIFDRAYNLTGAQTRYILQVYDNRANRLDISVRSQISGPPPPRDTPVVSLRIIVDFLNVWTNAGGYPVVRGFELTLQDLYDITDEVEMGLGDFRGLGAAINPLRDSSQVWIRLVRDNSHSRVRIYSFTPAAGGGTTITRHVTVSGGTIAPIDHVIMDNLQHPTFVTIAEINTKFEGFGAAWWAPAAASDPAISNAPLINPTP